MSFKVDNGLSATVLITGLGIAGVAAHTAMEKFDNIDFNKNKDSFGISMRDKSKTNRIEKKE